MWTTVIVVYNYILVGRNVYISFLCSLRFLEFMMGIVIAYLLIHWQPRRCIGTVNIFVGIVLLIILWRKTMFSFISVEELLDNLSFLPYGIAYALIISGMIIIDINIKVKRKQVLLSILGDASYSIYLTHFEALIILYGIMSTVNIKNELLCFIIMCIGSVSIGIIAYYLVEKPIVKLLKSKVRV